MVNVTAYFRSAEVHPNGNNPSENAPVNSSSFQNETAEVQFTLDTSHLF